MPRRSNMFARAERRATMILPNLPRTRPRRDLSSSPQYTCPYCSKTMRTGASRERHMILKPYCRARHLQALRRKDSKRRKRKRKRRSSDVGATGAAPERPSKQPRFDHLSQLDQSTQLADSEECRSESENGGDSSAGEDRVCEEVFVEDFPITTAGKPILSEAKPEPDLCAYLDSCGRLKDPKLFDVAELLMMTVPKAKDRTKHLKSPAVSSN
jgi:hypothetical protein